MQTILVIHKFDEFSKLSKKKPFHSEYCGYKCNVNVGMSVHYKVDIDTEKTKKQSLRKMVKTVIIDESDLDNALNISLLRDDMDQIWHIMNSDEKSVHNAMDPMLIQREKERAVRSQLNSANGVTAEIHDQFYRDHKLLIKLFQTLAVMPITRSAPGKIVL